MPQTEKDRIHKSWQKFLAPLVQALIGALSVYCMASHQSYSHDNDATIAVMEQRISDVETLKADVKELSKEVHELIGEIRGRVSLNYNFVRKQK